MIDRFLEQIRFDAAELADDPELGESEVQLLLRVMLDRLEEAGTFGDSHVSPFHQESQLATAEVHGYSLDSEDDVLNLFFCIDGNQDLSPDQPRDVPSISKDSITRGFRRLEAFLRFVRGKQLVQIDKTHRAWELVTLARDWIETGGRIELHVFAVGSVTDRGATSESRDGVQREVWDLVRLLRTCGSDGDERLTLNLEEDFGCRLPCLVTPAADDGIQVLLTCIPGAVLADIYNTYRSRLLERNVRSFLQFTGKVNKGIRETIINAPARFLPYNNGLSATASRVDLTDLGHGVAEIRAAYDFQIVNGGQTTASLSACVRRDRADLSRVSVPMKLTIVPREQVDQLVPLISKCANTQNRIQEADFSANHPWHVALERVSRETWTRPSPSCPRGSRWFYERSRGQYADELAAEKTPASRRKCRTENPSSQKFTKTDLAKFVMSWDQRPSIVSLGAQKCFAHFMNHLNIQERNTPDREEFLRIGALGILFRTAERLCGQLEFVGYRANVVTYSLGRLSVELGKRLPWDAIWDSQAIPDSISVPLAAILTAVRQTILNPPSGNITEWCKREQCWSAVLETPIDLSLPDPTGWQPFTVLGGWTTKPLAHGPVLEAILRVPASVWFSVAKWAKETDTLVPRQRSIAYSLGQLRERNRPPTVKQAASGRTLLLQASDSGFRHSDLTDTMICELRECSSGGDR